MKRILIFLSLLIVSPAWATTYWTSPSAVSTTLTDCDGDADPLTYCTFDSIRSGMSAGDTLKGKEGTYNYVLSGSFASGSSSSAPTTFDCETEADPPNGVAPTCILRPTSSTSYIIIFSTTRNHVVFKNWKFDLGGTATTNPSAIFNTSASTPGDNLQFINVEATVSGKTIVASSSMFNIKNFTNVVIRNSYLHDCLALSNPRCHGVYGWGSDILIENNLIHDVGDDGNGNGIQYFSSPGTAFTGGVIRFNRIYNVGARCILVGASNTGAEVYGNVCFDSNSHGIEARQTSGKVYNNLTYSNGSIGLWISNNCSAAGCTVRNNISNSNGTDCTLGSSTNSNNLCGGTATDIWIDPTNATSASKNFNLKEGSAAIAAGVTTGLPSGYNCVAAGGTCDQGPYQAPVRNKAVVNDADPTNYHILFDLPIQGTRNNVGLQTCTYTNFAIVVAGSGAQENSCSILSTGIVTVELNAAVTVGQSLTDAHTRSALPTLMDNVNIGGTYAHVRDYAAASGTNDVDAGATPAFTQSRFRFHFLNGTEASPTNHAAENTSVTLPRGAAFRLRIKFKTDDDPASTTFALRYSKDAGAYTAIPDTMGADLISWYGTTGASDIPSAGSATTELLTSDETTNVACAVVRSSSDYPALDFNNGEAECEYVLQISNGVSIGTTYDFRVYKSDGTALDTYTTTPRLTIGSYIMGSGA